MLKGTPNKNKRTELINSVLLALGRRPSLVGLYNWLRKVLFRSRRDWKQRRVTTWRSVMDYFFHYTRKPCFYVVRRLQSTQYASPSCNFRCFTGLCQLATQSRKVLSGTQSVWASSLTLYCIGSKPGRLTITKWSKRRRGIGWLGVHLNKSTADFHLTCKS